jgi:hypothetical protein
MRATDPQETLAQLAVRGTGTNVVRTLRTGQRRWKLRDGVASVNLRSVFRRILNSAAVDAQGAGRSGEREPVPHDQRAVDP